MKSLESIVADGMEGALLTQKKGINSLITNSYLKNQNLQGMKKISICLPFTFSYA